MRGKLFKRYSTEERNFLRENFMTCTSAQMAAGLGRTESSVVWQLVQMKLKRGGKKIWTSEELERLRMEAPRFSRKELAARFNVTVNQVVGAIKNHKIKSGRTGYFSPGHEPWSKGKKMPEGWGGATKFKKGQVPHNILSEGTIIIRKYIDGSRYKWIKISKDKWKQLSHVVYDEHYGRVPEGFFVIYKDRNTLNCEPSNLTLESKAEHMKRNTIARFPPEIISTIFLLSKFKRKLKKYAEKQN